VLPDPGASPSVTLQRRETEIALADQLALLPADYRQVIVLRHIEALPFEDVARRMGRSSGAVRMLWLRAVKALRERLDAQGIQ
jgi:RNA polymerase sigma-70 factor (ECF subfamily)